MASLHNVVPFDTDAATSATGVTATVSTPLQVVLRSGDEIEERARDWRRDLAMEEHPARHPGWLVALRRGLRHDTMCLEATRDGKVVGVLPLSLVNSWLFGRFLVSLPYLNSGGVLSSDGEATRLLIDRAVQLADKLDARHLELRHETSCEHPMLTERRIDKVHMRLTLPSSVEQLSAQLKSKLRSQIRSGQKRDFQVCWGREDCLNDFYSVFSRNMRDLGTPVFGLPLFQAILAELPSQSEFCVLRLDGRPVAGALLVHGKGVTEVPSASSLREVSSLNANMLMYWHLLTRAVERGQSTFDFGRSTEESNTYRFKKQWGAVPYPSVWQYYVRKGSPGELRPDHSRFGLAIKAWRRLPLWLANRLGPSIVRGIP